jgi:hypothetical protein
LILLVENEKEAERVRNTSMSTAMYVKLADQLSTCRQMQLSSGIPGATMMTTETVAHDSATCTLGFMGQRCSMCEQANNRETVSIIEQSTAAIHARRRTLLERATPGAPADGAVALAEAHLRTEDWWPNVPTNEQEDEWVMELAGRIQKLIDDYLGAARKAYQREQRRLREDG